MSWSIGPFVAENPEAAMKRVDVDPYLPVVIKDTILAAVKTFDPGNAVFVEGHGHQPSGNDWMNLEVNLKAFPVQMVMGEHIAQASVAGPVADPYAREATHPGVPPEDPPEGPPVDEPGGDTPDPAA